MGKRTGCGFTGINYQLAFDGNGLRFDGDSGGVCGTSGVCSGVFPSLNSWAHVAGTFDGSTFKIYIDGQLAGSGTGTLGPTSSASLKIGASGECGALWRGLIDEVEIFNRALSLAEIQAIYNAGNAGKCKGAATVSIDIKPGGFPNSINPGNHGTIPVAILSNSGFSAPAQVDPASLTFGRTGDEQSLAFCNLGGEDVNGDGLLDLVCHFNMGKTGFQPGDTQGVLKGRTFGGILFMGVDTVNIVP